MRRSDLEHLIRAAGDICGERDLVIIGSQAILGQFPEAPLALLTSMEADIYPLEHPELADKVDGAIGEGSRFHETHGYYAQGVGPETAVLPTGWRRRLVRIENRNTAGKVGLCLEVHDLAISKYAAGREKDREFTRELARHGMTKRATLLRRLAATRVDLATARIVKARIERDFQSRTRKPATASSNHLS
jgi:hypothetical protein